MGSLSAATMKRLMKVRQVKRSLPEEKEPLGMELPSDSFIKETADKQPFIAEVEDDEKSFNSSDNTAFDVKPRDFITKADDAVGEVRL